MTARLLASGVAAVAAIGAAATGMTPVAMASTGPGRIDSIALGRYAQAPGTDLEDDSQASGSGTGVSGGSGTDLESDNPASGSGTGVSGGSDENLVDSLAIRREEVLGRSEENYLDHTGIRTEAGDSSPGLDHWGMRVREGDGGTERVARIVSGVRESPEDIFWSRPAGEIPPEGPEGGASETPSGDDETMVETAATFED